MATQATFLREKLEPALAEADANRCEVFFVDAAHFVRGAYLCCVWCFVRMMIRARLAGSGTTCWGRGTR